MIYPGKNSIIESINIHNLDRSLDIREGLYSKKLKNYPFIENYMYYKNILIEFNSIFRPSLKIKYQKPSLRLINLIKKSNQNTLILGASSGLGYQVLNLLKTNNKIKIIATYLKKSNYFRKNNIIVKNRYFQRCKQNNRINKRI